MSRTLSTRPPIPAGTLHPLHFLLIRRVLPRRCSKERRRATTSRIRSPNNPFRSSRSCSASRSRLLIVNTPALQFCFVCVVFFQGIPWRIVFFSPSQDRPVVPPRGARKVVGRIYRRGLSHCVQHPTVARAVPVCITALKIQLSLRGDAPDGALLGLAKHRFSDDPSRPFAESCFQPRRTHSDASGNSSHSQPQEKSQRRRLRQRFQRSAYKHDCVPLMRVPRCASDRFLIKPWNWHSCLRLFSRSVFLGPLANSRLSFFCPDFQARRDRSVWFTNRFFRSNVSQIHFVRVQDLIDPAWRQPYRFFHPHPIIACDNFVPVSQSPKKSPFKRRPRHKRSIQIKKSGHTRTLLRHFLRLSLFLHSAPCATRFALRACPTPETKRHPSASTGTPRIRQNPAVIQVSTCAPTRTIDCESPVMPPISATGPRVNASSSPR